MSELNTRKNQILISKSKSGHEKPFLELTLNLVATTTTHPLKLMAWECLGEEGWEEVCIRFTMGPLGKHNWALPQSKANLFNL